MLQVIRHLLDRVRGAARPESREIVHSDEKIFHRPALAREMAADLMSRSHASGMFLTAPRRTGKTTFIRYDLIPTLERERKALVLYADLWERRAEDPGAVIVGLVEDALKREEGWTSLSLLRRLSLSRLKAPGVEVELAKADASRLPSLRENLERLSDLTRRTVVLIVDEAQHAQTTQFGRDVLFMLKSARDHLSICERLMFRLVMTGSHHAKIERMIRYKHEAFYCASLKVMPTLGDADYLTWERAAHGPAFRPSLAAMSHAFEVCFQRPEVFHIACCRAASLALCDPQEQERALSHAARDLIEIEKHEFLTRVMELDALDQVVLRQLAETGTRFAPYMPETERRLIQLMADMHGAPTRDTSPAAIRAALGRLREANLVWCGDGPHVLEESLSAAWLKELGSDPSAPDHPAGCPPARPAPAPITRAS